MNRKLTTIQTIHIITFNPAWFQETSIGQSKYLMLQGVRTVLFSIHGHFKSKSPFRLACFLERLDNVAHK